MNPFDKFAERYDEWYNRNYRLFEKELEIIPPPDPLSVEIGVGTGRFAEKLGIDVGIDISLNMLALARKRGLEVVLADGKAIPFKIKSFGSAYLIFTICFAEKPEEMLNEARRVLRDDGKLHVCFVPSDSGLAKSYMKKNSVFYRFARFYSESEVKNFLSNSGFRIVERRSAKLLYSPNDFVCFTCAKGSFS